MLEIIGSCIVVLLREKVIVDDGACEALKTHTSLLPKGIKEVEGSFMQGSVIDVLSF